MADLWQVTLVSPPYSVLTYERPPHFPELEPGLRVIVPLGRSHRMGVVVGPAGDAPEGVEIKPLIWPLEVHPLLSGEYLDMAANLAARQMAAVGRILEILLPRGLRTAAVTFKVDGTWPDASCPDRCGQRPWPGFRRTIWPRLWTSGWTGGCGCASMPGARPRSGLPP